MIQTMMLAALAAGIAQSDVTPKSNASIDGVWTVVAIEVNGRPSALAEKDAGLAIRNSTLTLPGIASMHGVIRIELGPRGMLRAIPAARGTGNRRDTSDGDTGVLGVVADASGVYVRTADYLVLTIGDPASATATGTGVGAEARPVDPATPPAPEKPKASVGSPPVSLVLKRSTGADAPPSTAAVPPPAPSADSAPIVNEQPPQRISTMMGTNVALSDGSSAGRIEDFVYSNGALDYAVLSSGGTFNAVPWNALTWNATSGLASIPLTRAQFATVPAFGANDMNTFLANPAFFTRVQNTFVGFRDINGNPVFNNIGMNTLTNRGQTQNQPRNQQGAMPANQTGARPTPQPGVQPGAQPGTPTGVPGVQPGGKAVPGGTDPNTITGNPAPPPGQPPATQPKGQPPAGQPKGVPPTGQPKGQPKGGQPKPPGGK